MAELNRQHGGRAHDRVLRLAVLGAVSVMPGGETEGGGDMILSDGAHREFTVHQPGRFRFENFADVLRKKANQRNTVEVYVQVNHVEATPSLMREWMLEVRAEARSGRIGSLRGIHIRLFDQYGRDLWEGRM